MIRAAQAADAPALAAIQNQIIAATDPVITFTTDLRRPEDFAAKIAQGRIWVAAEDAGPVLGFASFGPFRPGPGYAHSAEHSILLAPQARGQGRGRALMSQVQSQAAAAGIHVLIAGIGGENQAAQAFHSRLGFAETARMPQVGWKAGRWQSLVLMQKTLSVGGRSG